MNDRIRGIAEQAEVDAGQILADILCNDIGVAEAWNAQSKELRDEIFTRIDQNQNKFAELIVQECICICIDNLSWHGHDEAVQQLYWLSENKLGMKL
jgi:hypothetical protein